MNDIEFGEEVRRQGRPETAGRSMKDLVYLSLIHISEPTRPY